MARKPFRVQLGGSLVAGVPGPQGPQGIQGPYYIPGISQTADDRFTMAFMGSQEHMPGVKTMEIVLPAGGSTHLLTEDDRLDDLTGNGVWYLVDQPGTIRNLLEEAGISQPAELAESQYEWTPMALIVTVQRGYQVDPDPENPTGLPHQQVSVYYVTSGETPETDGKCYRYQMDRVQVFKDYSSDGSWTKWRSFYPFGWTPVSGQETAGEIMVVNGISSTTELDFDKTFDEIFAAYEAGNTIFLWSKGYLYYCAGWTGAVGSRFMIFRPFVVAVSTNVSYKWLKLTEDNTWSENDTGYKHLTEAKVNELIDANVAPMCVNVVDGVANASFQEMLAAVDIGRIVIINDDSHNFIFTHKENNKLYFARICDGVNPLHQKLCVSEDEIGENWIYWPESGHEFTEEINKGSNNNYFVPTAKAVADYVETAIGIANPDWNANEGEPGYIQNRPFYDEMGEGTVTRAFDGTSPLIDAEFCAMLFAKKEEATYIVDGKECVYVGIANQTDTLWSIEISGDGKSYFVFAQTSGSNGIDSVQVMSNSGTHPPATISFQAEVMVPHKLDPKYLPMDAIMAEIEGRYTNVAEEGM